MNQERTFRIKSFNNLKLRIFTIGYPIMGESVLFLLCDKDEVLFSVITDCYCVEQEGSIRYNHLDTILTNYGINQIDAFIWTHPDEDHSIGIENILDFYDKQHIAEIFIPEGLVDQKKIKGALCSKSCCVIDYLYSNYSNKKSLNKNRHIHTVSTEDHEIRDMLKIVIYADDELYPITCKFRFVLPYVEYCKHASYWDMGMEHNVMSIVYSIEMNGRNYVFTGDLMDEGTKMMSESILTRINYIKIPHHGSEHSKYFQERIKHFKNCGIISTSTRFNKKEDPKNTTLSAYYDLGDVYYITNEQTNQYGCIETEVDVMNDTCITNCVGNAVQFMM